MVPVGKFFQEILLISKDAKGNVSKQTMLDVVQSHYYTWIEIRTAHF